PGAARAATPTAGPAGPAGAAGAGKAGAAEAQEAEAAKSPAEATQPSPGAAPAKPDPSPATTAGGGTAAHAEPLPPEGPMVRGTGTGTGSRPTPASTSRPDAGAARLAGQPDVYTAEELAEAAGCDAQLVRDLQQYGLISANATVGGVAYFDPDSLGVVRTGAGFAAVGVEPRHLRAWRNAADREASLYEQLVMPLLRQRNPQARRQAAELLERLASLGGELRAGLVHEAIRQIR
ncbi:MAG: hypothetical protein M0Z42_10055, partial [Actinomycetota bacterium]|nr:hypothetical protein [Actinomycetota bacterium]